jgi:inorganic pyrophosphatase
LRVQPPIPKRPPQERPERTDIESELTDVRKLSKRAKQDLKQFFEATDALDNKKLEFIGWGGPAAATKLINKASR